VLQAWSGDPFAFAAMRPRFPCRQGKRGRECFKTPNRWRTKKRGRGAERAWRHASR
jgi:hypothetical protein